MPKRPVGVRADVIAKAAAEMGRRGGLARARALTKEQRAGIARKAAAKRWAATRGK